LAIGPVLANVNGIAPFDTVTFTITNGTAPYVVTSSCLVTETLNDSNGNGTPEAGESNFWDVTVAPYTFVVTVPAGAAPSTCTLTVTDFVGKTATSKLQIN
jgi:hypothetical protein